MDNEVVVKVDNAFTFRGYYNNPEATKKAIVDGWYYTGDAAYVDENGHLFFMDRISEMMSLSDGFKFSPTYMESEIRCSQFVADVMIVGQQKDFIAALIQIDLKNVGLWAEAQHIAYNTFVDLSQKEQVYNLIAEELKTINSRIPERSRVRVFVNLHKEFDADEAEMTRTRKLRRAPLFVKYGDIIEGIYSGASKVAVQTEVKYRDGRKGTVKAEVLIKKI
jgi:long-chain acyl-CoA synthetase